MIKDLIRDYKNEIRGYAAPKVWPPKPTPGSKWAPASVQLEFPVPKGYTNIDGAAKRLSVSRNRVYVGIREGKVTAEKQSKSDSGQQWRYIIKNTEVQRLKEDATFNGVEEPWPDGCVGSKEASKLLGMYDGDFSLLVRSGKIEAEKIRRGQTHRWAIPLTAIERYKREHNIPEKVCQVRRCHGEQVAEQYCAKHLKKHEEHVAAQKKRRRVQPTLKPACLIPGCDNPQGKTRLCVEHSPEFSPEPSVHHPVAQPVVDAEEVMRRLLDGLEERFDVQPKRQGRPTIKELCSLFARLQPYDPSEIAAQVTTREGRKSIAHDYELPVPAWFEMFFVELRRLSKKEVENGE